MTDAAAPDFDCSLCPRLRDFREANRARQPGWHNAPVDSFGDAAGARLLIVGLAPGLKGANRTGRPFTGDHAGGLLYATLLRFGLASGNYGARPDDGLILNSCRVTNAVRCVPPENRPSTVEIKACRPFLEAEIAALPRLEAVLALGKIAHDSLVGAFGLARKDWPFRHGALHRPPDGPVLADSYHCSRLNTNTGRLTEDMFHTVIKDILKFLDGGKDARP